ncbi:PIN domain-containing protein [Desulfobulbus oligotrophicus]|uniref:PIN domain-containing protein n=1 Tax=Desulfobulbus oligotrophicus TaxID=1909699 RepID=A0A7T5VE25_9BACT|nr:PIN domain-containing protein [Desulfobulbus oligotrophicus]QQG66054.1 PIN domain-containing protein [Desulfobulbus oligotrophicus]
MRCLIDTNILISAALFPDSVPARAFMKAVSPPHDAVVCDYSLDEMRRVYNRKFPHKISDFERFLSLLTLSVEIVSTPEETGEGVRDKQKIRDLNDRPIYLAALAAGVDGILTGDKDFLDSGITHPRMITSAEFMRVD